MLKRIQINFTPTQLQQLKSENKKTGVSIAGLVRLAVNDFFLKLEAK